jgi:hypothetical protein
MGKSDARQRNAIYPSSVSSYHFGFILAGITRNQHGLHRMISASSLSILKFLKFCHLARRVLWVPKGRNVPQ